MNYKLFSTKYIVKKLNENNIDEVYNLCKENKEYYEYCPPMVTKETIVDEYNALPPDKCLDDKYYLGYYDENKLIAILDFIDNYPEDKIGYIGLFMVDINLQSKGIGTIIINELTDYLKSINYKKIRLAWIVNNNKAENFWIKNGFQEKNVTTNQNGYQVKVGIKEL